jgi:hypothetical protein
MFNKGQAIHCLFWARDYFSEAVYHCIVHLCSIRQYLYRNMNIAHAREPILFVPAARTMNK